MGRRLAGGVVSLVLMLPVNGCAWMFGPQGPPADPLFANRKPVESKAQFGPAVAPPFSEPTPPNNLPAGTAPASVNQISRTDGFPR